MSEEQAPNRTEILERLRNVRSKIRITKITCTRSVKGRNGDSFVGFSAAWQSVQDDHGGHGADLVGSSEEDAVVASQGMSLEEAKLARYMLAMECDLAALESAAANGSISSKYFQDAVAGIRANYNRLVLRALNAEDGAGRSQKNRTEEVE